MLSSGMVMLQTTNSIINQTIYDKVHPQSLWAWQRVRLANSMATNGREWAELFKLHNSGTYNNQYMVIDTKNVKLGQGLKDGTLWVVEQIPGLVERADKTDMLNLGYWPSYNVPYFPTIYELSGYPEMVAKHGSGMSYQLAPRAQIFRRDQANVVSYDSLKFFMRYNDYKNDPISQGDAYKAICSRGDLAALNPSAGGCYDTKVTSIGRALNMVSDAVNGPTNQGLPPFSWSATFANMSHVGLPQVYEFNFITMDPKWD